MPVVACPTCSSEFNLKPQYVGRSIACTTCGLAFEAIQRAEIAAQPQASPAFDRDRFFMAQKVLSLNERYTLNDENGTPLIFVIRRSHFLKAALALVVALVTFFALAGGTVALAAFVTDGGRGAGGEGTMIAAVIVGIVIAVVACIWAAVAIYPKRHVEFYADEAFTTPLLDVQQDAKWQLINATFTVRDAGGTPIARLHKNYLYNFIRRRWNVFGPDKDDATLVCRAFEDSILLSILRRFLGTFFGLLRTNFIITERDTDRTIGEFNRKFSLTDKYMLDLSGDPTRQIDRRVAVALAVMLDTGEKR